MISIKPIVATLLLLAVGQSALAQSAEGQHLTYSDAYALANGESLTLKAHEHEMQALFYEKRAASALRMPQINLMANYTYMSHDIALDLNDLKDPIKGAISGIPVSPDFQPVITGIADALTSFSWGALTLQQNNFGFVGAEMAMPIYMGGKINAANNAANINIEKGENRLEQQKGALNTELAQRYFGLLLALEVLDVRNEVVAGMEHHYNNALSLERNGQISKGERLYAEMFLDRAKAEHSKSTSDVVSVNRALGSTLNMQDNYKPTSNMFVMRELDNVDFYVDYALTNSPLLKDVELTKALAEEKQRATKADLLPHLTAIGGVSIVDHQVSHVVPDAIVGVNLSYKLFAGAKSRNNYKSSVETIKRVELLQEKARMDVETLIIKSFNDLQSLSSLIQSYNTTIAFAQEYLAIKTKAFNQGVATSADVVDAQLNLAKSKIEQVQKAYEYDIALAEFLAVCGLSNRYVDYMQSDKAIEISYK